ncbi:AraC family transcriptional regulator [Polaribacter reichenbachii]|uniref:Transcriptional regulator n=1 Tax=Polaribacter reichenbachii TaxID=996801 RepID=A0A1B8TUG9_9FLAO|nr:helix-turn-helix domain-containing protein [Polaribacter reichenbachii]APZ45793.1 AraC family transcriptional regulator [Polaribacter reichenbachii]AUC19655.1 AraC family transcriptional regulator [Polaribacter reichenbachii]OBY63189.1 transcriptional regulator [Polaribacter reichenbachii]
MAVQNITNYSFKDIFSVSTVAFEKACTIDHSIEQNNYSIYWIQEGNGTYNIDFEQYTFTDNVLFFLSPGQVFTVDSEQIKTAYKLTFKRDFYCIQTHDAEVACNGILFNNIYETPFVKPCEKDTQKLNYILENLIEEFQQNETAQYDMLQSYLKQFIINSVRIKKENHVIKEDTETRLFKDFSLLVEQNFKNMHTVTDYANRLGLSPKSITKHFQKLGAKTPSEFIKNRILLEAKRLLIYTDKTVKEIAFELGFNDPAYFTRFFTKAILKSPLQFKKEY